MGRAYALSGDTAKARAAYQEFFTLWRNADPDVPILKQAKAEYAKLLVPRPGKRADLITHYGKPGYDFRL